MPMYSYKPPQNSYLPPAPMVYNTSSKQHGYYPPARAPSKYEHPSGGGQARFLSIGNSTDTSSYASYSLPQQIIQPHPPPSTQFGRGINHFHEQQQSPSSQYLFYNRPSRSNDDDLNNAFVDRTSSTYPRYPKPSSSSHQSRYTGPLLSPDKANNWWRK